MKTKKVTALILALALMLVLVACIGNTGDIVDSTPGPAAVVKYPSVEDLPPLIIAPTPPPLPEFEIVSVVITRQMNEPERTDNDLAQAVANSEIAAEITKLWIRMTGDNITDLSPLVNLPNLRILRISNTQVSDLTPLAGVQNLEELWIENSPVSDLSPLTGLLNLREIYIEDAQELNDISPLNEITNLTLLGLVNTQVKDISPLRSLTNLKELNLKNSPVTDITMLNGMRNIRELYLDGTRVPEEQISAHRIAHPICLIDPNIPY